MSRVRIPSPAPLVVELAAFSVTEARTSASGDTRGRVRPWTSPPSPPKIGVAAESCPFGDVVHGPPVGRQRSDTRRRPLRIACGPGVRRAQLIGVSPLGEGSTLAPVCSKAKADTIRARQPTVETSVGHPIKVPRRVGRCCGALGRVDRSLQTPRKMNSKR